MTTHRRHLLLPIGIASAVALGGATAVAAGSDSYIARSFTEPATGGLAPTGSLSELRAVSRARVIVPGDWQRQSAKAGQLRFLTSGTTACRYRVTFTVRSRTSEPQNAPDYVAERLPAAGSRYILDRGERGNSAFRVIREKTTTGVRLRALRAAVLTRRSDVVPSGQAAWSEISVIASSRPGDECHSGSYRQRVGPQLGDALASARTTLKFVRKTS